MWEIMTRWDAARAVKLGAIQDSEVDLLEKDGFDGAPVFDATKPIAFASVPLLRELAANGAPLKADNPGLWTKTVESEPQIDELLRFTVAQPAAIVVDEAGSRSGFFTLSDLNRHPVRAALYPLFAELEAELAILVDSSFEDPWDWLKHVPKDRRAGLIGYWEISKRDGADIGPIAGAMLSELGQVVENTKSLRQDLGFDSVKSWKSVFGGLNEQRHSIMHPVRPLVSNLKDLAKLVERLDKLLNLIGRVTALTSQREAVSL
jgi:hypothetical protein